MPLQCVASKKPKRASRPASYAINSFNKADRERKEAGIVMNKAEFDKFRADCFEDFAKLSPEQAKLEELQAQLSHEEKHREEMVADNCSQASVVKTCLEALGDTRDPFTAAAFAGVASNSGITGKPKAAGSNYDPGIFKLASHFRPLQATLLSIAQQTKTNIYADIHI